MIISFFYGSGKELFVLNLRVVKERMLPRFKRNKDIKEVGNVGFTVKIPEIIKLAEEHENCSLR